MLKRFGYDNALLFDLDGHDEWTIGAWVYVNGKATATLKLLGYDDRDGDAEMSKTATLRKMVGNTEKSPSKIVKSQLPW
jgi:hypothetical protein